MCECRSYLCRRLRMFVIFPTRPAIRLGILVRITNKEYFSAACITRAIRASRRTSGSARDDTRRCVVVITHLSRTRLHATEPLSPATECHISQFYLTITDFKTLVTWHNSNSQLFYCMSTRNLLNDGAACLQTTC